MGHSITRTDLEAFLAIAARIRAEDRPDAFLMHIAEGDVLSGTDILACPAANTETPLRNMSGIFQLHGGYVRA